MGELDIEAINSLVVSLRILTVVIGVYIGLKTFEMFLKIGK